MPIEHLCFIKVFLKVEGCEGARKFLGGGHALASQISDELSLNFVKIFFYNAIYYIFLTCKIAQGVRKWGE